jgi:pyruvate dehydrogenase E2 component (dihydrolipoamide acetyltransferase)
MAADTKGDVRIEELDRPQQVLARRVAEARATVPELTLRTEADMGACVAALRGAADPAPTSGELVVKAAALALRETPRANASYRDGHAELYSRVNVGFAVPAGGAILYPTLHDADRKPLGDLVSEARALAERARGGAITAPELGGATFTVVSLEDVAEVTPIIAAPQAGTLGAGAVRAEPVVRDGGVIAGHRMTLTLVCDHRILHGAIAAGFLARVRALLEAPGELGL